MQLKLFHLNLIYFQSWLTVYYITRNTVQLPADSGVAGFSPLASPPSLHTQANQFPKLLISC